MQCAKRDAIVLYTVPLLKEALSSLDCSIGSTQLLKFADPTEELGQGVTSGNALNALIARQAVHLLDEPLPGPSDVP